MLRAPPDSLGPSQPSTQQNSSPHPHFHIEREWSMRHLPSVNSFYKSSSVSGAEKRRIYDEWTSQYLVSNNASLARTKHHSGVGKPHNLICSQCRNPDDLIPCETCCRSYHAACLQRLEGLFPPRPFYCPSCRQNQWDQSVQFDTPLPSSNVSRSSTPSVHGPSKVSSPSGYSAFHQHRSIQTVGPGPWETPNLSVTSPQQVQQLHQTPSIQPELLSQAKEFLMTNGNFPADQEFSVELLSKLGFIMAAVESQNALQAENRNLREENASLRSDNANMRDYFNAKLPTREPMINTQAWECSTDIPNTTADPGDKAWDRIVSDMI
ncbi:PHD finger protein [Aspergillus affinis]|uniref:PHD finger protein n=1 Tax=Aspergillus affinis TaxID=1070780 RepID=UPI0022FF4405|nr:uncharacterized protein KD926_009062 [Aspergillus affinis]KAI9039843.1 hypothetical protein KD926_009062 [Aspergillus affinis]